MKKIFIVMVLTIASYAVFGQEILYNNVYNKKIKTVLMYLGNDNMSLPILDLGGSKKLTLKFDELDLESKDYYYRIIHCNSNWTRSNLYESEYIDGYFEDRVSDYQSSFNTTVNYTHYSMQLPNDYMQPVISGNYVLQVYESSNPDDIVFNKRFLVVERSTGIEGKIRNVNQASYFYNDQELEIKVEYFGTDFYDINQNLKLQVLKNYNWTNHLVLNQADVIRNNEFIYNNFNVLKFKGGNEFHHFNTKNIHYVAENIKNISFVDNMYHFLLDENKDRTFEDYQFEPDINGRFKPDVSDSEYPESEADYSYVYFTLKMDVPLQQGDVYVWGALTNYEFNEDSKMTYNFEQKAYEARLLLKQGFYNYQYVTIEKGKTDFTFIEGNHAITENHYTILVYYHDYRGNYDRLIGVGEINSKSN